PTVRTERRSLRTTSGCTSTDPVGSGRPDSSRSGTPRASAQVAASSAVATTGRPSRRALRSGSGRVRVRSVRPRAWLAREPLGPALGLVDLAFEAPDGARTDYHDNGGADDLDHLSRYDGLRQFRVNEFGAYALGSRDDY